MKGLFIGSIAQIFGEVAAEEATLWNAFKFILMLWPPWSIWTDMRSYLNVVRLSVPFVLASTDYTVLSRALMTLSSGFTSSSPRFCSLATQRKVQALNSSRTKTSRCLFLRKATKLFEGRPRSCWLQKVSVSSNSYGMHGTFQSSDLRTLFKSSSLSSLPSS